MAASRIHRVLAALLLASVAPAAGILVDPALVRADSPKPDAGKGSAAKVELLAPPGRDVVQARVMTWVAERGVTDQALLQRVAGLWSAPATDTQPEDLFELTIQSFALVDEPTARLVEQCELGFTLLLPPSPTAITRSGLGPFYTSNMALYYGRYLVQRKMFEEALETLAAVSTADVVDPAALLFHRAVCQHQLLMKVEGLKTVEQLLRNTEQVPVRYATVATLMQYDLEALAADSLDEVSRKMSDVERRLNLGRTGPKVQKREDEIVASLDALIKKIEEQSGGGGGGGSGSGSGNQPNAPAGDSTVKGSTAPGNVDKKQFKTGNPWGSLPAKDRAKAKDLIARDFPANYRQAVEEFTRKSAERAAGARRAKPKE